METYRWGLIVLLVIYVAVCFGKIAAKHGKNPLLYGILSIISPINLILLGYWAFSKADIQVGRRLDL
jgi:hypothetical protein